MGINNSAINAVEPVATAAKANQNSLDVIRARMIIT